MSDPAKEAMRELRKQEPLAVAEATIVDLADALRELADYVFRNVTDENRDRPSEMKLYDILKKVEQRYPRE